MRAQTRYDVDPPTLRWRTLYDLLPWLAEFKARIALALALLVAAKLATVAAPFLLKRLVDTLDVESGQYAALPLALLLAYGLARFSTVLLSELRDTVFGRVTERAMRRIGLRVFEHLHSLDLAFHLDRNTGGLFRDIERGVSGVGFLLRFMVFNIVPTLLELLLVLGILFSQYRPGFGLITLAAVLAYVAYSIMATEWRTRYVREANLADSQSNTRALDSLLNYETVKYFNNEAFEARAYDLALADWEQARRKNRLTLFALNGGQALIVAAGMTAMMTLAAQEVLTGAMTLGDFVLINAFMMQIFLPLNFLGFVYREMKGSLANLERLFALLHQQPSVREKAACQPLQIGAGAVAFDQVSFGYGDRPLLDRVSFRVEAGERVAIVGPSGAGKSTLVRLLYRFYDTQSGEITIDGQSTNQITLASLRKAIAIVPQDTVLFNTSLLENVRYGRIEASDEEVATAIRHAHLEPFVAGLPEGVHTLVGERGLKLSGGEKQRVAIARAILKDAPILIFDEATSSLDSISERSILDAMRTLSQNRTSLVIAHRLSTVVDADRIVVLRKGRVVEQGSHAELLQKRGEYARLWRIQEEAHIT